MRLFSNEIVFRGHPDKVCDQIAAAILRAYMDKDRDVRAGIEVVGGKGKIFITGEVTSTAAVDIESITKRVLKSVGYNPLKYEIIVNIGKQSENISRGVNIGGAGDQGMMFGYACDDTPELLPTAMVILQLFAKGYDEMRQHSPDLFYPDGKAQITGYYDDNFKLTKIKTFTISYQNCEKEREKTDYKVKQLAEFICYAYGIEVEQYLINPTSKFQIGGFEADSGLTGRKIVVDAYQSFANVGGGSWNGKDPSKVDFSASMKAREIAKDILKKKHLRWCEVQLSYAIGVDKPLGIYIDSDIGPIEPEDSLYAECSPSRMIEDLNLKDLDYEKLAMFGYFAPVYQVPFVAILNIITEKNTGKTLSEAFAEIIGLDLLTTWLPLRKSIKENI